MVVSIDQLNLARDWRIGKPGVPMFASARPKQLTAVLATLVFKGFAKSSKSRNLTGLGFSKHVVLKCCLDVLKNDARIDRLIKKGDGPIFHRSELRF